MYQAVHTEMETISRQNWSPRLRRRSGPDHHHGLRPPAVSCRSRLAAGWWCRADGVEGVYAGCVAEASRGIGGEGLSRL